MLYRGTFVVLLSLCCSLFRDEIRFLFFRRSGFVCIDDIGVGLRVFRFFFRI